MLVSLLLGSLIAMSSTTPPVNLATCEVDTPTAVPLGSDGDNFLTIGRYDLHVRFSNATSEQISRVTFTLDDGTKVNDVGTFSPGININHSLGLDTTSATSCTVTAVDFASGKSWNGN